MEEDRVIIHEAGHLAATLLSEKITGLPAPRVVKFSVIPNEESEGRVSNHGTPAKEPNILYMNKYNWQGIGDPPIDNAENICEARIFDLLAGVAAEEALFDEEIGIDGLAKRENFHPNGDLTRALKAYAVYSDLEKPYENGEFKPNVKEYLESRLREVRELFSNEEIKQELLKIVNFMKEKGELQDGDELTEFLNSTREDLLQRYTEIYH